jgi:hypothetical protein
MYIYMYVYYVCILRLPHILYSAFVIKSHEYSEESKKSCTRRNSWHWDLGYTVVIPDFSLGWCHTVTDS